MDLQKRMYRYIIILISLLNLDIKAYLSGITLRKASTFVRKSRIFSLETSRIISNETTFQVEIEKDHKKRRYSKDEKKEDKSPDKKIPSEKDEKELYNIKILIIDNYDSYTYNLYQYIAEKCMEAPVVVSNDVDSSNLNLNEFDGVILSPGPGTPLTPADVGICTEIIRNNPEMPILGVCLGHQLLGHVYGAQITNAPIPKHGLLSTLEKHQEPNTTQTHRNFSSFSDEKNEIDLFENIPIGIEVVRYHSLIVSNSSFQYSDCLPLEITSTSTDDKVIMSMKHKYHKHFGVQFHPESIGTMHGRTLLHNFLKITVQDKILKTRKTRSDKLKESVYSLANKSMKNILSAEKSVTNEDKAKKINQALRQETGRKGTKSSKPSLQVYIHSFTPPEKQMTLDSELVFEHFFSNQSNVFWLDSSSHHVNKGSKLSRFSIMGGDSIFDTQRNDLSHSIIYNGVEHPLEKQGLFRYQNSNDTWTNITQYYNNGNLLDYLSAYYSNSQNDLNFFKIHSKKEGLFDIEKLSSETNLPFSFIGGYVGYFGYEFRYLTLSTDLPFVSYKYQSGDVNPPTAALLFSEYNLIFDHWMNTLHFLVLAEEEGEEVATQIQNVRASQTKLADVFSWIQQTKDEIIAVHEKQHENMLQRKASGSRKLHNDNLNFIPDRSKSAYLSNIKQCHSFINQGESYELCLTNHLETNVPSHYNEFDLYKILRKKNPAPFASFMRFNVNIEKQKLKNSNISVCCSSPERFLSIRKESHLSHTPTKQKFYYDSHVRYLLESKPIKGTFPRALPFNSMQDKRNAYILQSSVKNQAENLMIVDLLRNDLGRICDIGSVHVPKLMSIESFATVHQMVSTIRGTISTTSTRDAGNVAMKALAACFPGGSMTGAPKKRSVELLQRLEEHVPRGLYSGCLGYISLNSSMDMNIIIRSAVITQSNTEENVNSSNIFKKVSIGAGGAITALSECDDEYDEMLLKAQAVIEAVKEWTK